MRKTLSLLVVSPAGARLPVSPWCSVALVSNTARLGGSLVWLARPL